MDRQRKARKKKEFIRNFASERHNLTQASVETLNHDFPSAGQGTLMAHRIYDVAC